MTPVPLHVYSLEHRSGIGKNAHSFGVISKEVWRGRGVPRPVAVTEWLQRQWVSHSNSVPLDHFHWSVDHFRLLSLGFRIFIRAPELLNPKCLLFLTPHPTKYGLANNTAYVWNPL
jgi:hypothetical protein